jgi:hypothetical protein
MSISYTSTHIIRLLGDLGIQTFEFFRHLNITMKGEDLNVNDVMEVIKSVLLLCPTYFTQKTVTYRHNIPR